MICLCVYTLLNGLFCCLFSENGKGKVNKNTFRKIQPSEKTKDIMKEKLTMEYEFYNFVKDRFHALTKFIQCTKCHERNNTQCLECDTLQPVASCNCQLHGRCLQL